MSSRSQPHRSLVFGVSAHGLGHLTRTCRLANALAEIEPSLEFHFWADFPRDRIAAELEMTFQHRPIGYEPGTAQRNCFELDPDQTVRDYRSYMSRREERLGVEREALRATKCDAVICDVPALLVRAASQVGLPAIAVSNFTWDWILEPILEGTPAEPVLESLREDYRSGVHHIQLPFGPSRSPFPSSEKGGLISRRAELDPAEVKMRLGLQRNEGNPLVLVCPGGWDPQGWPCIQTDTKGFDLILVGNLPVQLRPGDLNLPHALPAPIRFPDLVNAVDIVLAKPGYGISSECVTHQTPLVTIDRPGFRETEVLRRELAKLGRSGEMSLSEFFDGRWSRTLEQVLASSESWVALPDRPDRLAARQVLSALGWA